MLRTLLSPSRATQVEGETYAFIYQTQVKLRRRGSNPASESRGSARMEYLCGTTNGADRAYQVPVLP